MNEESKVQDLKWWIKNEAEFHGRTDDDFLLMFLRSCHFDISLTMKTLVLYYQNRIKFPQWWANRNVDKLRKIINLKSITILMDKNPDLPTVIIVKLRCFGSDSTIFNDLVKLGSVGLEMLVRRPNYQKNGFIIIYDCKNYPLWLLLQLLRPSTVTNLTNSFVHAMPVIITKDTKVIFVNTPRVTSYVYGLAYPFLGQLRQKVHIIGSDLSKLRELVPLEILPEEYGGHAGSYDPHHDACFNDIQEFNDYLIEDEKYGFVTSTVTFPAT